MCILNNMVALHGDVAVQQTSMYLCVNVMSKPRGLDPKLQVLYEVKVNLVYKKLECPKSPDATFKPQVKLQQFLTSNFVVTCQVAAEKLWKKVPDTMFQG